MEKYSRKNISARPAWQNSIRNPTPNPMPKVNVLTNTCLLSIDKSPFYAILRTFSAFSCNFFATLCGFSFHLMRVCVGAGAGGHGCTGKQKRNSIFGVSNSIKSQIWIKFNLSLSMFPHVLWITLVIFPFPAVGSGVV